MSDFKPLYKADYSVQGGLVNDRLPARIDEMFAYIMKLSTTDKTAPSYCIAWLTAMIPPFKKFFKDYDILTKQLKECETLRDTWYSENRARGFPIILKEKIIELYTAWWEAYNDSGAGIRSTLYIPRNQKIKDAVRRA